MMRCNIGGIGAVLAARGLDPARPTGGASDLLYNIYEMQRTALSGAVAWASVASELANHPLSPMSYTGMGPVFASAMEVFAHAAMPRGKPAFDIEAVEVDGRSHAVSEAIVLHRPFGNLLHFTREGLPADAPKVLLVAPMSGHYATLLRGTVARLVEHSHVFITDWADAREVPVAAGRFDLDDYIDYLVGFLEHIAEPAHVVAVCQPSVPALAATALMNEDRHPLRPLTLTMMGGPIDTREAPTSVNDVAVGRPLAWFRYNVITTVPLHYAGAGRRVYPGFLQLAGFMSMNLKSHMMSHWQMFRHLVEGDGESADATKAFYDEYRSVCDMTAEFYLQTIVEVFQKHSLPKGEFVHRGKVIDTGAIKDVGILAIEGERDDISGLGQTKAALTISTGLPDEMKKYYMAKAVGHYGIFNGNKWRTKIAPVLEEWIVTHND